MVLEASLKIPFVLLTVQLFLNSANANQVDASCTDVAGKFEELIAKIYIPNVGLLKDADKTTNWMYWDRLEKAFHAARKEDLDALFTGPNRLTFEKIEKLFFDKQAGLIKLDNFTEKFVDDFYVFLQDHRDLLDGKPDQSFRILKAFQDKDKQMGLSAARTDASISTDAGMRTAERTLLNQALAEMKGEKNDSLKWYDGIANFFSPHNKRMAKLLNNNNQLRKKMQSSYASVEPVDDVLEKYAAILSADEATKLKAIITSSGNELAEVREAIEAVYGKQLTTSSPIKTGEIRLRALNKTVKDFDAPDNLQIAKVAEERLDQLDAILKAARERKGMGPRPMSEYHPAQLEIRNTQHTRETGELAGSYSSKLSKTAPNSDYTVTARWDITYNHSRDVTKERQASRDVQNGTDDAGNPTYTTEYYTETYTDTETWSTYGSDSGTFTLDASYGELLSGKVSPDTGRISPPTPTYIDSSIRSASTSNVTIVSADTAGILQESKRIREIEKPLLEAASTSISKVEEIRRNYQTLRKSESERASAVKKLMSTKEEMLGKVSETLEKYTKLSDQEIKALWPSEIPANFRSRNSLLLERYLHLAKRIDHFAEQVGRNVENLELSFVLPDYSAEMTELNAIAAKNLKIQVAGGTVIGAGAAGGGYYAYDKSKSQTWESSNGTAGGKRTYTTDYLAPQVEKSRTKAEIEESMSTSKSLNNISQSYTQLPEQAFATPVAAKASASSASAPKKKEVIKKKNKTQNSPATKVEVQNE